MLQGLEAQGIAPNFVTNAPLERFAELAQKTLDDCMTRLVWLDANDNGEVDMAATEALRAKPLRIFLTVTLPGETTMTMPTMNMMPIHSAPGPKVGLGI